MTVYDCNDSCEKGTYRLISFCKSWLFYSVFTQSLGRPNFGNIATLLLSTVVGQYHRGGYNYWYVTWLLHIQLLCLLIHTAMVTSWGKGTFQCHHSRSFATPYPTDLHLPSRYKDPNAPSRPSQWDQRYLVQVYGLRGLRDWWKCHRHFTIHQVQMAFLDNKKNESCWCSFKHFREKGHVRSCDQWWSGVPKWCLKGLVHPSLPSIRFYFTRLANIPKSWDTRYLSHVKRDLFGSYSWKLAPGNSMHNHNHSCFQGMARTIKNHSTWVFCKWPSTKTSLENNPSLNKPHFYTFLPWGLMISRVKQPRFGGYPSFAGLHQAEEWETQALCRASSCCWRINDGPDRSLDHWIAGLHGLPLKNPAGGENQNLKACTPHKFTNPEWSPDTHADMTYTH